MDRYTTTSMEDLREMTKQREERCNKTYSIFSCTSCSDYKICFSTNRAIPCSPLLFYGTSRADYSKIKYFLENRYALCTQCPHAVFREYSLNFRKMADRCNEINDFMTKNASCRREVLLGLEKEEMLQMLE